MQRSDPSQLPVELQQLILDQFQHAFPFDSPTDLKNVIQEVKGHLYNRDFITAFLSPTYLQAYALRWSAGRALAYAHIFSELEVVRKWQESTSVAAEVHMPSADVRDRAYSIICIGGGAGAELVALASTLTTLPNTRIEATAIDIANWSDILTKLEGSMKRPLPLSKYASESARAANTTFIESSQLDAKFVQQDILACKDEELRGIWRGVSLCTIMFTLNELFTSSIAKTTALLLKMTGMMQEGSFLLVVDSPGSYSEIKLGKDGRTKRYPMKWLMDHALLEVAGKDKWEKIMDDDSRWFRLPSELKYPIDLENMRYQIHLYRRLD
jgi:25S rRNA (uracil2843-N3)-methyltransferase